ncbi:MAG: extracellular solute-binding protein [Oscillospiraceae bacterium]|jgi:putative aldouronate transport system substrate-binding protein|nr:extracellular solute-binding protein [Oscillospiraceae bacterium]
MRKFLSMILGLALIAACFAFPAVAEEAPYVITVLAPFYAEQPPVGTTGDEGNPVLEAAEALGNVDLQITWAPQGDYVSKFNTIMASADLPMVLITTSGLTTNQTYLDYSQQGVFWDLTDEINSRPLFKDELTTPYALTVSAVGGRSYLFPFVVSSARVAMLYRADWLEALNMEVPTTAAEFYEMAKAFTENDPDGNGVKDTYGFAYIDDANKELTYAGFDTLAVALGAPNRWGYSEADGKIMPYFTFPEYLETLNLFKDMFDNSYMNNDFALIKGNDKHLPLGEGKAGAMFTTATNGAYPGGKYDALITNVTPTARIERQYLLTTPSGVAGVNSTLSVGGMGGMLLPKASVKSEEDVSKVLDFYEKLLDKDQGAILLALGVEDLHYTKNADGTISVSPEQRQMRIDDGSSEVFASTTPRRVVSPDYGQPRSQNELITAEFVANEPYAVPDLSVGKLDPDALSLDASIATIISDARVQYIMGQIDEAGFQSAVADWIAQGGDSLIEAVNAE